MDKKFRICIFLFFLTHLEIETMQKNVNTFIQSLSSLENHTRFQSDQKGQNLYSFSDQKGVKTLPVGTAHTYIAYVRKYPHTPHPPPPPTPGGRLSTLFVHWDANSHTPSYA